MGRFGQQKSEIGPARAAAASQADARRPAKPLVTYLPILHLHCQTMALIFGASAARLLRRPKFHRFARAPASLWPVAAQVLQTQRVCPLATRRQPAAASEEDLAAARKWLQALDSETIPKNICDVSFSRSSGPGGQNVNKYRLLGFSYLGNYLLTPSKSQLQGHLACSS